MGVTIITRPNRKIIPKHTEEAQERTDSSKEKELLLLPFYALDQKNNSSITKVYFELETYAFYQRFKQLFTELETKSGILRYHRKCKQDMELSLLVEDLFVFTSLLGEPEDLFVKRSKTRDGVFHVIVMMHVGDKRMAHIEYTLTDTDAIELEWSGEGVIFEYHSEEMKSLVGDSQIEETFELVEEQLIESAHSMDATLFQKIEQCRQGLEEGHV